MTKPKYVVVIPDAPVSHSPASTSRSSQSRKPTYVYAVTNNGSSIQRALSQMDFAAKCFLRSAKAIEGFMNSDLSRAALPVRISVNGALKAFSVIPNRPEIMEAGKIKHAVIKAFADSIHEEAATLRAVNNISSLVASFRTVSGAEIDFGAKHIEQEFKDMCASMRVLGRNPNLLARLAARADLEGEVVVGDAKGTSVSIGRHTHHPAFGAFKGAWLIRIPVMKDTQEAPYVPSGCRPLASEVVKAVLGQTPFESLPGNHGAVFEKIRSFQAVTLRVSSPKRARFSVSRRHLHLVRA